MSAMTRLAVVGAAVLLATTACGTAQDSAGDAPAPSQAAVQEPAAVDPYAWTDVDYQDYRAAALAVPISTDLLVAPAALTQSLDTLCHTDPAGFAQLLTEHQARAQADSSDTEVAKHLGEEVGLRLGMACPQRMGDWLTAQRDAEPTEDSTTAAEGSERSTVESPQEVEGEKLPENPYVDSEDEPMSIGGAGGS
ncbi:MAG: hypothetical protein ACT4QG_04195 [Sporichthyaceae bacterium]